jgi:hypothetical protein
MKNDKFNMVDFANGVLRQQRDLGTTKSEVTLEIARNRKEQYEIFKSRGFTYVQYQYEHINGLTFLMVGKSLEDCRAHRNEWIERGCEL